MLFRTVYAQGGKSGGGGSKGAVNNGKSNPRAPRMNRTVKTTVRAPRQTRNPK